MHIMHTNIYHVGVDVKVVPVFHIDKTVCIDNNNVVLSSCVAMICFL